MSAKTAVATEEQTRRGGSKKKYTGLIILTAAVVAASVAVIVLYTSGKARYEGKFLPDTFINGVDVGGLTVEQACEKLESEELADTLTVQTIDNEVTFSTADFDYASNTRQEIENMYKQVNHTKWYEYHWNQTDFTYTEAVSYDKDKLKSLIKSADWGSTESSDATVEYDEEKGYSVVPEVVGDKITDMDLLTDTIVDSVDSGKFTLTVGEDSGCYTLPTVVSDDLSDRVEKLNKVFNMSITYDFDYTTETLSGSELLDMLDIDEEDGSYTVDSDKAMAYVEKLAEKYDTYDTPRKFKATLQGDITVPRSDDAKYGWWIWQDETCDALVKMLEEGETVESVDPIYYSTGYFDFTGVESARSADDDIGTTYIEIDLTAQHLWYYKEGKLDYETDIVSGQTTSEARTTLPGVYKLWFKDTNFRMQGTNEDGDEWDVTCSYWNNVSLCGIGLHDSAWRGNAFGGNIYKTNGSHGCINMPPAGAKYVYDNVEYGTPVVMYY